MAKYKIISFYKFINLEDTQFLKTELLNFCNQHDIKGTIIVANEGINSTLSANQDSVDKFCKYLNLTVQYSLGKIDVYQEIYP